MSETSKSFSREYCDEIIESIKFEEGHCVDNDYNDDDDDDRGESSDKIDYETKEKEQVDLKPVKITGETLKRIRQQLCLIKLGSTKVELDHESCSYFQLVPKSYSQNSEKEKVLLWHAENFRQQFQYIYGVKRKPLLMVCDNEFGIQVCIINILNYYYD